MWRVSQLDPKTQALAKTLATKTHLCSRPSSAAVTRRMPVVRMRRVRQLDAGGRTKHDSTPVRSTAMPVSMPVVRVWRVSQLACSTGQANTQRCSTTDRQVQTPYTMTRQVHQKESCCVCIRQVQHSSRGDTRHGVLQQVCSKRQPCSGPAILSF
jgi:hypothetical protein